MTDDQLSGVFDLMAELAARAPHLYVSLYQHLKNEAVRLGREPDLEAFAKEFCSGRRGGPVTSRPVG